MRWFSKNNLFFPSTRVNSAKMALQYELMYVNMGVCVSCVSCVSLHVFYPPTQDKILIIMVRVQGLRRKKK